MRTNKANPIDLRAAAIALVASTVAVLTLQAGTARAGIQRVVNPLGQSYIVTLRNTSSSDVPAVARRLANEHEGSIGFVYQHALKGFSIKMSEVQAEALSRNPAVALVEEDAMAGIVATEANPPMGLDRIDQRDLPLSNSYSYQSDGAGVHAYILDTGIRAGHQEFGGRASVGYDAIGDGQNGNDCHGHGTHVAGTVGGASYGVAKAVSIVAVRVLDCAGSGSWSQVIAGIDWVTANKVLPAVANMSLAGGATQSVDNAVANSINSGIVYSVAAGNGNSLGAAQDACTLSPSRTPAALTVSATDSKDSKASWANYGSCVDLFASGVGIVSAYNSGDTATATMSGTSMATPHVTGVAAQYLEVYPAASAGSVAAAVTSNSTPDKVLSPGAGTANRLLYSAFVPDPGPRANIPPTANFTYSCLALTCSFNDTSTDPDGSIASRSWSFGDATNADGASVSHSYSASGSYAVTLTVTDNSGAASPRAQTIAVSSDPDPATPTLSSGVARSGASGGSGTWQYYKILVPAGKSLLKSDLAGCSLIICNPDLDLFVRQAAKPSTSSYSCRSAGYTSTETCSVSNPASAWWYVGVRVAFGTGGAAYQIKATV